MTDAAVICAFCDEPIFGAVEWFDGKPTHPDQCDGEARPYQALSPDVLTELSRYARHVEWRRLLVTAEIADLYRARPHKWGAGKTHYVGAEGDRTLCGKPFAKTPGDYLPDVDALLADCRLCARILDTDERQERRWEELREQNARWWADYNAYMSSPEWQNKRHAVFARSGHTCEQCGVRRAVQVHHVNYDRLGHERLSDLLAICLPCHRERHPYREWS
jgi:5-methylcytosine-specific restriction endonuclease McrA